MQNRLFLLAAVLLTGFTANPAFAHHVVDGGVPNTLMAGLLSGLGHPIIGVDHFAFILAMGLAALFTAHRYLSPLAFILMTVAGCVLHIAGTTLPLAEIVVAGSVLVLGALILSGHAVAQGVHLGLFAIAGLFHGWAYGESIIGAEPTPLVAYVIGFAAIQYAIAIAAGSLALGLWRVAEPSAVKPRLAGAVAAGIGAAFLIENVEGMLFG